MRIITISAVPPLPGGAPGRPRDPRIDRAVLGATVELLERVGYHRLTIAAIAPRAGTTTPAIYRRWPTKAHLVHEAVFPSSDVRAVPEHDDLRSGIRAMLLGGVALLERPAARAAVPGLLAELTADPELHADILGRFAGGEWGWLYDRVSRAIDEGEVRPDVRPATLLDIISGSAFLATAVGPAERIDDRWVDEVVDLIMRGIAGSDEPPAPTSVRRKRSRDR